MIGSSLISCNTPSLQHSGNQSKNTWRHTPYNIFFTTHRDEMGKTQMTIIRIALNWTKRIVGFRVGFWNPTKRESVNPKLQTSHTNHIYFQWPIRFAVHNCETDLEIRQIYIRLFCISLTWCSAWHRQSESLYSVVEWMNVWTKHARAPLISLYMYGTLFRNRWKSIECV